MLFGVLPIGWGGGSVFVFVLFCCALLCVLSSFAIILKRKRELVDLLFFAFRMSCHCRHYMTLLHDAVVALRHVIVVFLDHTHLLFEISILGLGNAKCFPHTAVYVK